MSPGLTELLTWPNPAGVVLSRSPALHIFWTPFGASDPLGIPPTPLTSKPCRVIKPITKCTNYTMKGLVIIPKIQVPGAAGKRGHPASPSVRSEHHLSSSQIPQLCPAHLQAKEFGNSERTGTFSGDGIILQQERQDQEKRVRAKCWPGT